jgi:hypothetical protein
MGLYDKILVKLEMLPITDKEKILLQNAEFQTNDLDRGRQDYRITDDGFLELIDWEWESVAKERRKKIVGYERLEDVHKDIFFHTHIYKPNKNSYQTCEFKARFSYGHLDSIVRV